MLILPLLCALSLSTPPAATLSERLVAEALAHGRAFDKLQALCTRAPRRISGSAAAEEAVRWAEESMRAEGLENVHREACMVPVWRRGPRAQLRVLAPSESKELALPILALGGSIGTPKEGLEAELIEVHSFDELRALGTRAKGAIVFFDRPMDSSLVDTFEAYGGAVDQRGQGAIEAAKAGAIAAIVRSMCTRVDDHPHTGAMHYDEAVPRVPAAAVSTRGAEDLAKLVHAGKHVRVHLDLDCETLPDAPSSNVVGDLRGQDLPDEIVIAGAHLDCWDVSPGAHDDGAGCAQVLEALRLLRAVGEKPKRTVRAVLFMNEENGLRGALAYRDAHTAELARHVAAIEDDRGGFAPRGFETDANPDALRVLETLAAGLEFAGAGKLAKGHGGADVGVLAKSGTVLLGLVPEPQRYFELHHSELDTLENVDARELELGAGVLAAMLAGIADLDAALPRNATK